MWNAPITSPRPPPPPTEGSFGFSIAIAAETICGFLIDELGQRAEAGGLRPRCQLRLLEDVVEKTHCETPPETPWRATLRLTGLS